MNVGSIADKYFSDTMVEAGKIPDDNTDHIVLSTFSFGGLTGLNGHAIATVNILKKEKESEPMRILLDQEDIQTALNAYVKTLNIPNAETATVELSVSEDGVEAEVVMGDAPIKNKGGRPKGSTTRRKPAPKKEEVTDAVEKPADSGDEGSGTDADSGGSDQTETNSQEGEAEAPPAETKGKPTSKNLFGDADKESSDSTKTTDKASESPETEDMKVKPTKKSSIFDVD